MAFVTVAIFVPAAMPAPLSAAPLSPVVKCAVAEVSVLAPVVTWASVTVRAIPEVEPGHMKTWIMEPRSVCGREL